MSGDDQIIYYTAEEEKAKKEAFARALMRNPMFPDKAAREVESRVTHISYILTHWQYDAEVNRLMAEVLETEGVRAKVPTKDEFAASLITEANECRDKETKLDYYKLFASVMGYVEKPSATTINNTVNNVKSNVLVLPERKSPKEIEARVIEQQRQLTSHERAS